MIKAITFDLDDTIWPVAEAIELAEHQVYDYLHQHCPRLTAANSMDDLRLHREQIAGRHPEFSHDFTELRTRSLTELVARHGYSEHIADDAFDVFYQARNRVRYYDDVVPCLDALSSRFKLAAITNGNACLELTGLDAWFDHVTYARDVGFPKPHPAIFSVAIAKLGCLPEEILHVGDHPEHDVMGATQAGMKSVWLDRNGADRSDGIPHSIASLSLLESFIEGTHVKHGQIG